VPPQAAAASLDSGRPARGWSVGTDRVEGYGKDDPGVASASPADEEERCRASIIAPARAAVADEISDVSRPSAAPSTCGAPACRKPRHAARSHIQAGTSRQRAPSPPASKRTGISARHLGRPPHAGPPADRTTDARDRRLPAPRSYGRHVVELYNRARSHQALAGRAPMAVWRERVTGALADNAVDMTLRLDDAAASPTCPPPAAFLIGTENKRIFWPVWGKWMLPYPAGRRQTGAD
jgi:hypothetical protein